ncbi:AraC family transcriptional regulator [Oxalobacter aliiformigenes]|uniref:AraC family transcriptional regulator n=1 Tax=Oxalobacter aliiformigenes TaxID=2946593 RepID=UPI002FCD7D7C
MDRSIPLSVEAGLHRHDAWELYCVTHGYGNRFVGDTLQPFSAGDVALIPPSMVHYWNYVLSSADAFGNIRYLMVAFSHSFVQNCVKVFPELRNRLSGLAYPVDALKFGTSTAVMIRDILEKMAGMDELGRLCEMLRLLPVVFLSFDHTVAGKHVRMERSIRRMPRISAYVMAHYMHPISLDEIAAEVGMNRSAFCSFFRRAKGMTFVQFVTRYRLDTACELLKHSEKRVSEIAYLVGFNDFPHFVRVFTKVLGQSPRKYRKRFRPSGFHPQDVSEVPGGRTNIRV